LFPNLPAYYNHVKKFNTHLWLLHTLRYCDQISLGVDQA
jgi:hypothetical protein